MYKRLGECLHAQQQPTVRIIPSTGDDDGWRGLDRNETVDISYSARRMYWNMIQYDVTIRSGERFRVTIHDGREKPLPTILYTLSA